MLKVPFLESQLTEREVASVGEDTVRGNHGTPGKEEWVNPSGSGNCHFCICDEEALDQVSSDHI